MKQLFAGGAATVVVLLFAATSATATALPIRIDACTSSPCNTEVRIDACTSSPCNTEGGSVDVSLEFRFSGTLTISATNNLVSGAVTQLAFNFEPNEPWVNPVLNRFTAVTGTVTLLTLTSFCLPEPQPPGMCRGPFDLSMTFPSSGTNAWAPGETIFISMELNLTPGPGGGGWSSIIGYARVEGACAPTNPAPCLPSGIGGSESYQLSSEPVTRAPEPSTLMLAAMGLAACGLVARRCGLTPR